MLYVYPITSLFLRSFVGLINQLLAFSHLFGENLVALSHIIESKITIPRYVVQPHLKVYYTSDYDKDYCRKCNNYRYNEYNKCCNHICEV